MIAIVHAIAYSSVALWLLTTVGNWACRQVLGLSGMRDAIASASTETYPAGRIIGSLERLVLAAGIVMHSWEIVAAVIALKTVARFKELDKQLPAEYFLVGSLFSLLWAMLVTAGWIAYDAWAGVDLRWLASTALGDAGS